MKKLIPLTLSLLLLPMAFANHEGDLRRDRHLDDTESSGTVLDEDMDDDGIPDDDEVNPFGDRWEE